MCVGAWLSVCMSVNTFPRNFVFLLGQTILDPATVCAYMGPVFTFTFSRRSYPERHTVSTGTFPPRQVGGSALPKDTTSFGTAGNRSGNLLITSPTPSTLSHLTPLNPSIHLPLRSIGALLLTVSIFLSPPPSLTPLSTHLFLSPPPCSLFLSFPLSFFSFFSLSFSLSFADCWMLNLR